jgi:hypothetical protein
MADLTLERIAELRRQEWPPDIDVTTMLDILDAAERGLLADRKAKAFDALAEIAAGGRPIEIHFTQQAEYFVYIPLRTQSGMSLLEAVESLANKIKEPTDAQ